MLFFLVGNYFSNEIVGGNCMSNTICGTDVYDCQLICDFNSNGGSAFDFPGILNYCKGGNIGSSMTNADCVLYYMRNCQLYVPPSSFSVGSSSSSFVECPSGNNDFDFENVKNGFRDYYEYFFLLFSCFILIKLLNLIK